MNVTWWCSASDLPWTWDFQAYPGIWLFQLVLLAGYAWGASRHRATRGDLARFAAAWLLLWAVLDWPVGALAAGYLVSAHMLQYLMVSLVIAPILVGAMPDAMRDAMLAPRAAAPLRAVVRRPGLAFGLFNAAMLATHLPAITDALKPTQTGSMAIDLVWIATAVAFWWSIHPGSDSRTRLEAVYGRRFLYVTGFKLVPLFLGAFFVFADYPLYRTYELAPRVFDVITPVDDQLLAGLFLWMGATPILLYRIGEAFFTWHRLESERAGQV